jgi:hypothetical protein
MKGVPFSPLVAPPKEATYIDDLDSSYTSKNTKPALC